MRRATRVRAFGAAIERQAAERTVIDAGVGGNIARFVNHSCSPNCYIDIKNGIIWIRASRRIRKGEELTYHYNSGGEAMIECHCRPGCQTLL